MSRIRAPSSETLLLAIGGLVGEIRLDRAMPIFLDQVRTRYRAFTLPPTGRARADFALRLTFDPVPAPTASGRDRLLATATRPLQVSLTDRRLAAERWDFRVALTRRRARSRLDYRGEGRCEASPFALDCVLRVLFATLLPQVGGMLIHGCGLRHGAAGAIFPGVSGAGKTTLARKAPDPDDVLSDELVAVRRVQDVWRVSGTPFWGDFARGGVSLRSWPLRGVAFLRQGRVVEMAPITSSDATQRLLGCFLAFTTDRTSVKRALAVAVRLCAEVRSVEASLTRTAPPKQIFRKLRPHLGPMALNNSRPANARELISDFRAVLAKRRSYVLASAQPVPENGSTFVVEPLVTGLPLSPGDVVLSWVPGSTADADALLCRRLNAAHLNAAALEVEVLGRLKVFSRDGRHLRLPARLSRVSRDLGSLAAVLRTDRR